MLQWRSRTDKSSISQFGMVVNPKVICCSLFLLFSRQLVSHRIKQSNRFAAVIQKPLHALQAVMRVVILHSVDFSSRVRRDILLDLPTVQPIQRRNSLQILVHGCTGSRLVGVQSSRKNVPLSRIFQQFHTERLRYVYAPLFARFLLGNSRALASLKRCCTHTQTVSDAQTSC